MTEEVIQARCLYVTMVSDDKSFVAADFCNQKTGKRFKASGRNSIPPFCSPDMVFDATGNWSSYSKNGVKYEYFNVKKIEPVPYADRNAFLGYLTTVYKGVGAKTAIKILNALKGDFEAFKEKSVDIEWLKKAVGKKLAASICEQTKEFEAEDELYKLMQTAGVTPKKIRDFKEDYGQNAATKLEEDPYILYEKYRVPFSTCESVCMMMLQKRPELLVSFERISCCATYIMRNSVAFRGHTYIDTTSLSSLVLRKLNEKKPRDLCVSKKTVDAVLNKLTEDHKLICGKISNRQGWFAYESFYYDAEAYIAKRIAQMCTVKTAVSEERKNEFLKAIIQSEKEAGIVLEQKQRDAVMMVLLNKFSVITGSAGTGKTTVLNICIRAYEKVTKGCGGITLAAPTGRAAIRMSEATGNKYSASTIHSLLGLTGEEREEEIVTPQQVESDILFVDESSMCEIGLFYKLLYNTDEYTKIVLIGDPNQLPPVGAGELLKSIIDSGSVPVTKLSVIYRQLNSSQIVYNATQVMYGKENIKAGEDFIYYPYRNEADIKNVVLYTFSEELKEVGDVREVQIITPMRERGELSAYSLNLALQPIVNPLPKVTSTGDKYIAPHITLLNGLKAYKGDKVICQKNSKEIKNGDIGIITKIYRVEGSRKYTVEIEFEGKDPMEFNTDQLQEMNLNLGYAITVHKAQGSEFKSVILPIAEENKVMLRRNLLYTAITRARRKFILIGAAEEVKYCIGNNIQDIRRTCLSERIKSEIAKRTTVSKPKEQYYQRLS